MDYVVFFLFAKSGLKRNGSAHVLTDLMSFLPSVLTFHTEKVEVESDSGQCYSAQSLTSKLNFFSPTRNQKKRKCLQCFDFFELIKNNFVGRNRSESATHLT